jgi:hypothetical protein
MTDIEQRVAELLAELADATPVGERSTATARRPSAGEVSDHEKYPVRPLAARRHRHSRRRELIVAGAAVAVILLLVGLLVLVRDDRSPVSVSAATLDVDTAALGSGRMAVVIENDLYVADGPTGAVWKLTDVGKGEEVSNVSFSHDGEWVAFTIHDESGLWVSRWDGTERHRIGRAPTSYTWSPVEDQLAYATQDQVRVARADGSSRALKLSLAPEPDTRIVWSPGGTGVAFVHIGGGTTREALEDTAEPEWGSTYTVPAAEVIAWPSAEVLLVAQVRSGSSRSLSAALMLSVATVELTEFQLGTGGDGEPSVSTANDATASLTPKRDAVDRCDLRTSTCTRIDLPRAFPGPARVVLSPDGQRWAVLGAGSNGTSVLSVLGSGAVGALELGTTGRGTLDGWALEAEPPLWLDNSALVVRVDERSVERIDVVSGARTTLVIGDRFLPPADDYPGGTGLAYWAPR